MDVFATAERASGEQFGVISPDEFSRIRAPDAPFDSVAAVTTNTVTMTSPGEATAVWVDVAR